MGAAKCQVNGSDFIGAFATSTDKYTFVADSVSERAKSLIQNTLKSACVGVSIGGTDLVGLFLRANSNGVVLSNMVTEAELERMRSMDLGIRIEVMGSSLNAVGNNILVNDRIAIVNPEYGDDSVAQMRDVFGVEVIKDEVGGYKTVGANSILTNLGLAINNRCTDREKEELDIKTGFGSIRTTANTGALSIGLGTVSNSHGVVVGDGTTGYELTRIMDALNIS